MKHRSRLALLASLAFAHPALSADITWDTSATAGVQGGAGTWDTTLTNWTSDGGTTKITWNNTLNAADTAVFSVTGGLVTLPESIELGGIKTTGNIGGYILSGGSLNFGSALGTIDTSSLTTSGANVFTINSSLVGSGGLTIAASGNLAASGGGSSTRLDILGDNRGLSGGIAITSGLVLFANQLSAGSNALTLSNGAGLVATGGNLLLNNSVNIGSGGATLRTWGSANLFLNGAVSGGNALNKTDGGAVFLGSNSLSSAINIAGGSLWLRQLNNGSQITIGGSSQPALGYLGTGETTDRVVNFLTNQGGIITAHGGLIFSSNMTGTNAAMGVLINGGGAASMNGINNTGALLNLNKQGLGIWTINGSIQPNGGNIRPQGGILAFSSTSSTIGEAIITASNRSNQGIIQFASGSAIKSASANTNGILGGWATFDNTTWAKTNGTGVAINGLATFTDDTWAAGNNTNVTLAGADPSSGSTTNSIRFNATGAKTLTLGGTNTLTSGGLMVTANVGTNNTTITGGTLIGSNSSDLILHQFNTSGLLTISSIVANNTGATGLTKIGAGTAVLGGANTYTGTTRVFEGTLRVTGNNGAKFYEVGSQGRLEIGYGFGTSVYGYGVTVNGNGVDSNNGVHFQGGRDYNMQSTLRLAGAPTTVRQYGSGGAVLYGFDTNGTHLAVESTASGSVIGTNVNFQPGSYGYVMNIAPGLNNATGDVITQGVFAGGTNGNGTHYRKVGFGSLRVEGAGTATTPFQIRQGSVILAGGTNRLGSGSSVRLGEAADSGLLVLEGMNQTLTAVTNSGTGTDNRVVGGSTTLSTLTINNISDSTLAAHLGGTGTNHNNIGLTKAGTGTLTLTGTNTHTGPINVTSGTLRVAAQTSLFNNTPANWTATNLMVQNGATLALNVGGSGHFTTSDLDTIKTLGTATGGFLNGSRLGIDTTGGDLAYAGGLTNTNAGANVLGLTKLGTGTLTLSGTNSFTGSVVVAVGTLEVQSKTNDVVYTVNQGASLRLGYTTGGGYAGTNLKLNGDGVAATTGLYLKGGTTYNASGSIELLTAPTTIRHYGSGLAGIGIFDINGNGLNISAAASGSEIDGNIEMISRGFGMSMTVASGAATATGDLVLHGRLNVGNLGFYKRGTGSVRLNQAATTSNTSVKIQGGTVIAGAADVLGSNADLIISSGASLRLNGFDQAARNLSDAGRVVNASTTAATLTISSTANTTFSGVLGGAGTDESNFAFTKTGSSTLTLSGTNTYTGATNLNMGTLLINGNNSAANGVVTVASGATLGGTGTVGGATTIQSGGKHSAGTSGTVGTQNFVANLTYASGSIFEWDLNTNVDGTGSAGTDFDKITSSATINAASGSIFQVVFGTGVDLTNPFWSTPHITQTWNMSTLFGSGFTGSFTAVQSTADPLTQGTFTISGTSLIWTAVPEPGTALGGLLLTAGLLRRRRRD